MAVKEARQPPQLGTVGQELSKLCAATSTMHARSGDSKLALYANALEIARDAACGKGPDLQAARIETPSVSKLGTFGKTQSAPAPVQQEAKTSTKTSPDEPKQTSTRGMSNS